MCTDRYLIGQIKQYVAGDAIIARCHAWERSTAYPGTIVALTTAALV